MVSIYTKPLPQIILTDFDAECDQVLFSVKNLQIIDDVSIKQSQDPSNQICKIEIVQSGVGTNYEENRQNISDEKQSSDVCDDKNKSENKENKTAPTNLLKKESLNTKKKMQQKSDKQKLRKETENTKRKAPTKTMKKSKSVIFTSTDLDDFSHSKAQDKEILIK